MYFWCLTKYELLVHIWFRRSDRQPLRHHRSLTVRNLRGSIPGNGHSAKHKFRSPCQLWNWPGSLMRARKVAQPPDVTPVAAAGRERTPASKCSEKRKASLSSLLARAAWDDNRQEINHEARNRNCSGRNAPTDATARRCSARPDDSHPGSARDVRPARWSGNTGNESALPGEDSRQGLPHRGSGHRQDQGVSLDLQSRARHGNSVRRKGQPASRREQ